MIRHLNRFYLLSITTVIIGFIIFVPKVTPRLISKQRSMLYESFAADIQRKNTVDPVNFWKFREFYSPGSFEFRENGFKNDELEEIVRQFDLTTTAGVFPFLRYTSGRIQSMEALLDSPVLPVATSEAWMNADNCILNRETEKYCKRGGNTTVLYFVKPLEEMKKANAFYDYRNADIAQLVKDKYWFVATIIKTD